MLFLAEEGPDHIVLSEQEEKKNMSICWHRRACLCCHRNRIKDSVPVLCHCFLLIDILGLLLSLSIKALQGLVSLKMKAIFTGTCQLTGGYQLQGNSCSKALSTR